MTEAHQSTKVMPNTYSGKPMFTVFKLNAEGEKIMMTEDKAKTVVNMGITKVMHILNHIEELREFAEKHK